jgi:hypothetical protein
MKDAGEDIPGEHGIFGWCVKNTQGEPMDPEVCPVEGS